MKKFLFLLCVLPLFCSAQPAFITTIVGSAGVSGFSGDGGPATAARMLQAMAVFADGFGNAYVIDVGNSRIRKVNAAGIITTVAGGGASSADGIPATNANLSLGGAAGAADASGNIYFADGNKIRKVDISSGTITTVAGTGVSGFSGDGGLASAAQLNTPCGICFDPSGSLYITDGGNHRIRKISTSGVITTIAGSVAGFSGDGGFALLARFQSPAGLCFDGAGNLYIADRYNQRIRKIDPWGVISTYAGNGTAGFSGDSGPATAATFNEPSYVCADSYGNLYIADYFNSRVRKVTPSGIISTFAGGGPSLGSSIPAISAYFATVWGIAIDNSNNLYIGDRNNFRVCKVPSTPITPTHIADSFSVFLHSPCAGPGFTVLPARPSASLQVKTWFGDGSSQMDTFSSYSGCSLFNHAYSFSGTYTIKHVLYNGSSAVDSLQYNYSHVFCNTIELSFYYDADSNCVKDTMEHVIPQPVTIAVDSNGITIDTISTTAGVYYKAYGIPGDVFSYRLISLPPGLHSSCPAGGVVYDTLGSGTSKKYVGLVGGPGSAFEVYIYSVIVGTGVGRQVGNIYVQNAYCTPKNAVVSLLHSPKYNGSAIGYPAAASVAGNTIIWNVDSLSAAQPTLVHLHYRLSTGSGPLTIGDSVHSRSVVDAGIGDVDTSNNCQDDVDTVRAGYDPNHVWVSPEGCMPLSATTTALKYTVNFENTGNDTAHNIYVLDTLSDYLDASSMRIEMASHEMYVSKSMDAAGRTVVKFDFPNIKLLDSSHHGLCDGAFIYTINTKPAIPAGEKVHARVGIYFDINEVVLTNTVENEKGCPPAPVLGVLEQPHAKPVLYPNPVNDELIIKAGQNVFTSFTITNSIGQEIMQKQLSGSQTSVNVKALPSGMYYVVFEGVQGREMVKFVKE